LQAAVALDQGEIFCLFVWRAPYRSRTKKKNDSDNDNARSLPIPNQKKNDNENKNKNKNKKQQQGHMQIFFSWSKCPLLQSRLPLVHKALYTNGTYAYLATIATSVVFTLVPFLSLVFGLHPVAFSKSFAIAATAYLPMCYAVQNYARERSHLRGQWLASVSNQLLCFRYIKAVVNTLLAEAGLKAKAGFKTTKKGGDDASNSGWAWTNVKKLQGALDPLWLTLSLGTSVASLAAGATSLARSKFMRDYKGEFCLLWKAKSFLRNDSKTNKRLTPPARPPGKKAKKMTTTVKSIEEFAALPSGRLDAYTLVPMLWAAYNTIPPLLFFIYFFTKGRLLRGTVIIAHGLTLLFGAGEFFFFWCSRSCVRASLSCVSALKKQAKQPNKQQGRSRAFGY
jgi:hypothetical protein